MCAHILFKCFLSFIITNQRIIETFSNPDYNADIRPMNDQSGEISVELNFELVKIVDVDDVEQVTHY